MKKLEISLCFAKKATFIRTALCVAVLCCIVMPSAAQRPVRGSLFHTKASTVVSSEQSNKQGEPDKRFADTLTITVGDVPKSGTESEDYEKAVELYQGKQYGEACAIFVRLRQTLPKQSRILPDVMFMNAECAAVQGLLEDARKILAALIENDATPSQVLEKSLVRLGHVFCGLGTAAKAEELFARLKHDFPNSAYLRVASCKAIE
ncbi:MAG: hypothetical protein LC116_02025 [Bacteroidetes bacterium]|nr:hypothetical protein [Bacteroidota bacterium]MCZ2131965.1 hypothetical protein [Bacteroidota bacterium]